jgi:hypothetical protein
MAPVPLPGLTVAQLKPEDAVHVHAEELVSTCTVCVPPAPPNESEVGETAKEQPAGASVAETFTPATFKFTDRLEFAVLITAAAVMVALPVPLVELRLTQPAGEDAVHEHVVGEAVIAIPSDPPLPGKFSVVGDTWKLQPLAEVCVTGIEIPATIKVPLRD